MIIFFTVLMACDFQLPKAQTIQLLVSRTNTSIRGLSVPDDRVIWVSGRNGVGGKSTDGGNTFNWLRVRGLNGLQEYEAFDETTAVIMDIDAGLYPENRGWW